MTWRERASTCSNMVSTPPTPAAITTVLLVHGLAGDAEPLADRLPRPALVAGVGDVERFELFDQHAQRRDRGETRVGVVAVDRVRQCCQLFHPGCQPRLTTGNVSTLADTGGSGVVVQ